MSMNNFASGTKRNLSFVVKNIITNSNKVIRIFQYPIHVGKQRDLLAIPGVSESDIRASLLKGELLVKLLAQEITIVESDIDLIQFNVAHKAFLENAGITNGLEVEGTVGTSGTGGFDVQDADLIGTQDGANATFTTSTKFRHTSQFKEVIFVNGLRNHIPEDYAILESGGPETGYDTIVFIIPPEADDVITIDYFEVS